MNQIMVGPGDWTLEERAKKRCALLNGQPCSFEGLKHKADENSDMDFSAGHIVNYSKASLKLYSGFVSILCDVAPLALSTYMKGSRGAAQGEEAVTLVESSLEILLI